MIWDEMWSFVRFVDIGGIEDHHCLNFLFIIVNVLDFDIAC
jgi:hypothetical protein